VLIRALNLAIIEVTRHFYLIASLLLQLLIRLQIVDVCLGPHFHIGDNILTDGIGAEIAHSSPIIINSNKQTIKDAYNIIIQGVSF
jgi:hypothetical protein